MRRILALAAVVTAVALAAPAQAKAFSYADAQGDMPANPGLDIVSVSYATEGVTTVTKVRGRRVTTYTPQRLVVALKLAGAPVQQAGIRYVVAAQAEECGQFDFSYAPGTPGSKLTGEAQLYLGCGGAPGAVGGSDGQFLDPKFAVKGSTLVWTIALKQLPKSTRAGAMLSNLKSAVEAVEPALGSVPVTELDTARSDADWDIA